MRRADRHEAVIGGRRPAEQSVTLYHQVGVECGNGWQRQENGGVGRALDAKVYIYVNDNYEAMYLIRGTDANGALLHGTHRYTMTFPKDALPPVDRSRGGF